MVLVRNGEIKMKQTNEDRGTARVSLEWRDLEYDIASMYTRDDGFERLEFLSHLDPRRSKRMEGVTMANGAAMYGRRRPRSKLTRLKLTDPVAHRGTCGTFPRSCM